MSQQNGGGHGPAEATTVDLATYVIDKEVLALIPKRLCERHNCVPVSRMGTHLVVAMADPGNPTTFEELGAHTGLHIEAVLVPEAAILEAIARYYGP